MTDPLGTADRVRRRLRAAELATPGDVRVAGSLLLTAPDGTQYVVAVANDGTLFTVPDDTAAPGSMPPVRPNIGSQSAATAITVADVGQDFTSADQVRVYDEATGTKLVAAVTGHPNAHTVTATVPAGAGATGGVANGQLYDFQVASGATVLVTYAGAFRFVP